MTYKLVFVIETATCDKISFTYADGKTYMTAPLNGETPHRYSLSIQDIEAIVEYLNTIIRNYHVREYRNEAVRE